jgi:LmbE family N-acetylglucosaminyl deacetylase
MPEEVVYVAPHPDDVALSCGGSVAIAARTESPLIVTTFAGQPGDNVTDFARQQHAQWGVTADSVSARRRAEDACAAAALGTSVRTSWLDGLDAIYRETAYDSDEALFGRLLPADLERIDGLVEALAAFDAREYVVPLGVGNHVDHQLVFRAGRRLAAHGAEVWSYADVPYVLDSRRLDSRLATGTVREARVTAIDDEAFERKCRAVECYTSQLPVIFRDHGNVRTVLDAYARGVGGGQRAEVCWRVMPSRNAS